MQYGMELSYRLRISDFDTYERLLPSAVLDLCQDVATLQAKDMGLGFDEMRSMGLMWAIVRMKYEVLENPSLHTAVVVSTWPHTLSRFSFLRDYEIKDAETGKVYVKATSEWVMMDIATRSFASPKDNYSGPMDFCEKRNFEKKPRKVKDFTLEGLMPYNVTPAFSDTDVNGHVNNAKYANFVMNALNLKREREIKTFQIDYRLEVKRDEQIEIYVLDEGGIIRVKGIKGDDTMFMASIELA